MKIEMPIKQVIVKGMVTQKTLMELKDISDSHNGSLQLTFDEIDTLPKSMVEWLSEGAINTSHGILSLEILMNSKALYSYFQKLNIRCKLIKNTQHSKEYFLGQRIRAIVIGGSAGSTKVIERLVRHFKTSDFSVFIVRHITEEGTNIFESILKSLTSYNVITPTGGETIQTKTIYIAPSSVHMRLIEGKIILEKAQKVNYARPSIQVLFESVAEYYAEGALAILTSGYGHDGSEILGKMRELGTSVIVHSPQECEAQALPKSAIATGFANHVLTLGTIESLIEYLASPIMEALAHQNLFLKMVNDIYGYDFTLYDSNSIARRIKNVMDMRGITDIRSFYQLVLLNMPLFKEFFASVSINVTEFFRKPEDLIQLRKLFEEYSFAQEHFKVWIAGCSTGEEAYTMAMILEDISLLDNAIIYATDYNSIITQIGRNGLYPLKEIEQSDKNASMVLQQYCLGDFFDSNGIYLSVQSKLRKKVLFFEHNLVADGSFNEFMLISCKNVLIYFSKELQLKVLQLLYDSLQMQGYLQLGSSETLPMEFQGRFLAYNVKHKIYQKVK